MKKNEEKKLIIDVDVIIESYNEKNPKLKPMTRRDLADRLGVNIQLFSDWKSGKTPRWAYHLTKLIEVAKTPIKDFIIKQ